MADQTLLNKQKFKSLEKILYGDHALIHLIPQTEGVILPSHLLNDPTVTLKISKLFNGYLRLEKQAIETELRFSGAYFECVIPYEAIWGVTDEKGKSSVWPESAPNEVLTELLDKSASESEEPIPKGVPKPAPSAALREDIVEREDTPKKSKKRPNLKLVKS